MDVVQYHNAVIELFKSGKATEEQWHEMAMLAVNYGFYCDDGKSETPKIDAAIEDL